MARARQPALSDDPTRPQPYLGSGAVPEPHDLGRQLRTVRRRQGLTRTQVARSAGLTRRELVAYERGRIEIPESDIWCLAGSCGVDVGDLLPERDELRIESNLASLTIGESTRAIPPPLRPDGLLREYLAMIYELRNLPPGSPVPLREADLATLADALGGTPEAIEARLAELIGANRGEATRLREMILSSRPMTASDFAAHDTGTPRLYAAAIQTDAAPAIDRFFDTDSPEPIAVVFDASSPHPMPRPVTGLSVDPFTPSSSTAITEDGLSPIVPDRDPWAPTGTVDGAVTPIAWRAS